MGFSLVVRSRGHSLVVVQGLLAAVASLIAELLLWAHRPQELWLTSSAVVTLRLSCSVSEIRDLCVLLCVLAQGSNPCLLHWQVDSLQLSH